LNAAAQGLLEPGALLTQSLNLGGHNATLVPSVHIPATDSGEQQQVTGQPERLQTIHEPHGEEADVRFGHPNQNDTDDEPDQSEGKLPLVD
jgi:hypothetical protein